MANTIEMMIPQMRRGQKGSGYFPDIFPIHRTFSGDSSPGQVPLLHDVGHFPLIFKYRHLSLTQCTMRRNTRRTSADLRWYWYYGRYWERKLQKSI